jgi:hypothetical protein
VTVCAFSQAPHYLLLPTAGHHSRGLIGPGQPIRIAISHRSLHFNQGEVLPKVPQAHTAAPGTPITLHLQCPGPRTVRVKQGRTRGLPCYIQTICQKRRAIGHLRSILRRINSSSTKNIDAHNRHLSGLYVTPLNYATMSKDMSWRAAISQARCKMISNC